MQEVPQETFKIQTIYTNSLHIWKKYICNLFSKNKTNICLTMFWKTEYMVYPFQTYSKLSTLKILAQYKSTKARG